MWVCCGGGGGGGSSVASGVLWLTRVGTELGIDGCSGLPAAQATPPLVQPGTPCSLPHRVRSCLRLTLRPLPPHPCRQVGLSVQHAGCNGRGGTGARGRLSIQSVKRTASRGVGAADATADLRHAAARPLSTPSSVTHRAPHMQVACRQLGFKKGWVVASTFAGKPVPYRVGQLNCFGNETRLSCCLLQVVHLPKICPVHVKVCSVWSRPATAATRLMPTPNPSPVLPHPTAHPLAPSPQPGQEALKCTSSCDSNYYCRPDVEFTGMPLGLQCRSE